MILFRTTDRRWPFLWEVPEQPPARWHVAGEGPVHYFADTPDGAWAEFLRHWDIRRPEDLEGIEYDLWAVELSDEPAESPNLPMEILTGGQETYARCQQAARRLRAAGATRLVVPSAALLPGQAGGWCVDGGLRRAPHRDGQVIVVFDRRPDVIGWKATERGRPDPELLACVRYLP